jgi:hypothetical protein
MPREHLGYDVVKRFRDVRQSVHLMSFRVQSVYQPPVVVSHLCELSCNLSWELYPLLQGGIGFQGLALNFLEQVWSAPEELVMGEFPSLHIC